MGNEPLRLTMQTNDIFPLGLHQVSFEHNGHAIISDLTLSLDARSRTVILGANGAGKSVTMRLMHGLLLPSAGRIIWGSTTGRPSAQAMVFQRPVMLRRSALNNITYALKLAGVRQPQRLQRAAQALDRVGLSHIAHRSARVLSGGEQQRVALARAWALEPRILFLDEPTASLDPATAREVERVITDIAASGTKIVMTTHNLGQARRLADEIVFIDEGRIVEKTPAPDFFKQPRSAQAAAFLTGELP